MGNLIMLPFSGRLHVCRERSGHVEPLAELPGANDSQAVVDNATWRVAILDSVGKRAGLFQLTAEAPWVHRVLPFATLPKDCKGHACTPLGDGLLVGGSSKSGEALWWRHPAQADDGWKAVELPAQLRRPGKAIDGLHRDGDTLIAVDDIISPKWLLLYRIGDGDALALKKAVRLPPHISYERIFASSLGESALWLISRGVNHGVVGRYVWGVSRKTWKQVACWSASDRGRERRSRGSEDDEPAQAELSPLLQACAVVQWQGGLLVACGDKGLLRLPLAPAGAKELERAAVPTPFKQAKPVFASTDPEPVQDIGIHDVRGIQQSPSEPGLGVFVTGVDAQGKPGFAWLSGRQLP